MSINLSDELHAATTKGKIASAKEVYLDGDKENLQQVGEKTHQMEEAIKGIGVSGGASVATAVSYENANSSLSAITAQAAIDELAAKDKSQDAEIDTKANEGEVNIKIQTVNENLDKKFDKSNVVQELGDSEEQVVSQAALPFRYVQNDEFIFAQVDAENHLLFGIQEDGTPVFGKNSTLEDDLISQVNELSAKVSTIIGDNDNTDVIDTLNEMKKFFASISNTQTLSNIINDISDLKTRMSAVETGLDKKFDKDNIAQELGDSEDKVVSQLALPFRIEESEEFLYLIKDDEDHVLFGIQQDGSVEWQVGIPSPIRVKIQEIVNQSQQDKTDLSDALNAAKDELNAALQAYKQTTDAAIASLQDTKVDKEEGKSLIDDEIKAFYQVIEDEEWMSLMTDAEGHILFGIKRDTGKPYFPLNEMYQVEQNEEFFALWLDAEDHILMGIRRDGQIIGEIHAVNALKEAISAIQSNIETLQGNITAVEGSVSALNTDVSTIQGNITAVEGSVSALNTKVSTIDSSVKELLDVFSIQDNPEYMAVETDAEGRILASTNTDGSHYAHNMKSETIDAKVDKEDGKSLINASVADSQSSFNDVEERMQITTDGDGKIMAYRDKDGVQHEHTLDADTLHVSNLNLKGNSVEDIKSALISSGFNVKTPIDWSDSSFIQIPEPRFAIINITNIDSMPTTKTQNKKAFLEFWDMQGNYFKKHVIANAQGNSSMGFVKKSAAFDFCDDEWIGDSTPKIRFGNWVPQDSFHAKAYYTDFFKGMGAVCYKLYDKIVTTRGLLKDRPWKRALINPNTLLNSEVSAKSLGNQLIGQYNLILDNGARCFPDGFPCAIYLNGSFYGIFSWQLKKHRDNYNLDKGTAKNIHLDGTISETTMFNGKDNIDWSKFEIRNPKNLYAIGGNKYDADIKQEEIAGEEEVNAWIDAGKLPDGTNVSSKIKKNLQLTAEVKKYIENFSEAIPTIKSAVETYNASSKTEEDLSTLKEVYEKYFDPEVMIDYQIISDLICGWDGFGKNWQWFTYDGVKWYVGLYDCDQSFGNTPVGTQVGIPFYAHHLGYIVDTPYDKPLAYTHLFYNNELEARYKDLADSGIISIDGIFGMAKDWIMRIGVDFYEEEYNKWTDSKCIGDSVVREEYWKVVYDENGMPKQRTNEVMFSSKKQYNVGDIVGFGIHRYMGLYVFECVKETVALETEYGSNTISQYSPISEFKYCDSIYRLEAFIEKQTSGMDTLYNYNRK